MSPSVHLRDTVSADSEFVFGVRRAAFRRYVELDGRWDEDAEHTKHRERFAHQRFRIVVVEGMDAGYAATALRDEATPTHPSGLYLYQLMLLPELQSMGIGSICFGLIAGEARASNVPLRLRVLRVNPRALAFFAAAGCVIVDESKSHVVLELRV